MKRITKIQEQSLRCITKVDVHRVSESKMIFQTSLVFLIIIICLPASVEASSLGIIPAAQTTVNSSLGEIVQLKFSYFNKDVVPAKLYLDYELLDEGTKYDLADSGNRIYLMGAPYPSSPLYGPLVLLPSTASPASSEDKGWAALGSGKYSEIRSVYLVVMIPPTIVHTNPYRIKLTATTETSMIPGQGSSDEKAESMQSIAQQVEYSIMIYNFAPDDPNPPLDSDYDGLTDYEEEHIYGTDPLDEDTDGDGVPDGDEVEMETDPNDADSYRKPEKTRTPTYASSPAGGEDADSHSSTDDDASENTGENDALVSEGSESEAENSGEVQENTGHIDNTTDAGNKDPTGLVTGSPGSGPVNMYTVVIFIICALIIYRVQKIDFRR